MRNRWKMSLLPLCAALLVAPASAHDPAPAQSGNTAIAPAARGAVTIVDDFHRALAKGDQTAASALITDNALIYESGGVERSKAEYASHHLAADTAFASATKRTVTRRSGHASGDIAWVATESTTTGTYKDRTINTVSTETMILRRENGAWRIAHIHWSSANVK